MEEKEEIRRAVEVLSKGGVILYPTDTVWGLGCDATNPEAVAKIFAIKRRPDSKSLVLLASDMDMVCRYIKEVPEIAVQLVGIFAEDIRFNERLACDGAVGKARAALKYA